MGRIKKVASQKHEATVSPYLKWFIARATTCPIAELPAHLKNFPRLWPFPRGDLYHWINALDRFDEILASVIDKYLLNIGPQTLPFGRSVLEDSYGTESPNPSKEDVNEKLTSLHQYGPDGDRQLVEAILDFSRLLLEKCGNRSLYSSSERLGDLLNTTSLSLLQSTLRLSLCLAQRYHSRQRGTHQQSLLATHYNIDLEKLQKIAAPFTRPSAVSRTPFAVSPAVSGKGVESTVQTKLNANDFASLVRDEDGWEEWGHVRVLYYPSGSSERTRTSSDFGQSDPAPHAPTTPTPLRRSATHPTPRLSRGSNVEDSPAVPTPGTAAKPEESSRTGQVLELPLSQLSTSKIEDILAVNLPHLPLESKYELLHKVRVAQALPRSREAREQILAIRILAVTNLAYVQTESTFPQKVLQYDMEQPKRLQLTYQLAEIVHLGASGDLVVSRTTQALALQALDALTKHKTRANDVCAALSVNVNHGVLMFLTRKFVNELAAEDDHTNDSAHDEWRDALLALLRTLPSSSSRTPETLVAAGLIPMFVDILNLRTEKARRVYSRVMEFLDTFVHAVRDALGTLTTAKGFDAISDLIDYETKTAFENVFSGEGFPSLFKNPSIDYHIPYFQQQTLRWMFRFVNHIMQHNGGGFDRVLRNLIDSPQLLTSLRLVFENARIFGSHVWSNAVNILSSFIHNEPTSYAVIAEAGLSRSLLSAVMGRELQAKEKPPVVEPQPEPAQEGETSEQAPSHPPSTPVEEKKKGREYVLARAKDSPLAPGIIAAADALACIPSAFGAICLNASGLDLFQSSDALESFFEIFESPEHVKCLKDDPNLVRSLGTTFDELVRHHPELKTSIMTAVLVMVARVNLLAKVKAWELGLGAKLWQEDVNGQVFLSGDVSSLSREIGAPGDASVEDGQAIGVPQLNAQSLPNGGSLVLGDVKALLPSPESNGEPKDKDEHGLTVTDYLFPAIRFLGAFFENQPNCSAFVLAGGAEFILDYATLQSLSFDFHNTDANQELTVLVHMLAETKPHLIIPSLLHRAQSVINNLDAFWTAPKESGFFTPLIKPTDSKAPAPEPTPAVNNGTFYVKHLNAILILTDLLREIYAMPLYQTRSATQSYPFSQVVLADMYAALVTSLGNLHAACVWEEIMLEKNVPEKWLQAIKNTSEKPGSVPGSAAGAATTSEPRASVATQEAGPAAAEALQTASAEEPESEESKVATQRSAAFKNVQTLRYLLSSLPTSITGFFHNLGLGLITRKRMDSHPTAKQNANMVADAIADAVLRQLQFGPANSCDSSRHRFAYLIVILSSFSHLLYEVTTDRPANNYLTLVLLAFKRNNGLKVLKEICDVFMREVKALQPIQKQVEKPDKDTSDRLTSAYGGIKIILALFSELASGKSMMDSNQTQALSSSHDRDRDRSEHFQAGQFIVDLRMEILPMVREMWNSEFATQSSSQIVKCLIDILRSSLNEEHEVGAAHRSDKAPAVSEVLKKPFVINKERLAILAGKGFEDTELIHEALYRCNNNANYAEEYCNARNFLRPPPRAPPGADDVQTGSPEVASGGDANEDGGHGEASPLNRGILEQGGLAMLLAQAGRGIHDTPAEGESGAMRDGLARAISNVLNDEAGMLRGEDGPLFLTERERERQRQRRRPQASAESADQTPPMTGQPQREPQQDESIERRQLITVEDLDEEREKVRSNLIERSLDVLNDHHDVSFELADLIGAALKNQAELDSSRRDVGETLVQSLVSLQMENFQTAGKKVAAYAHILALVLQDPKMYAATVPELKDCFTTFLGFIKLPPAEKSAPESFPWIGHVLLILEKLLSDDCQPPHILWQPPSMDDPYRNTSGPAHLAEPLVSLDQRTQLFEAIVEILPRIGKDDSLALSVCRILVILTRHRSIAVRFAPKRNLQRLFLMIKQLANATNEKLQSAFMLILRHIVEDEATIRHIMTTEIVGNFESKPSRQIDAAGYVRQMSHLVIRNPEIFVEVSNEKLRLARYDPTHRTHALALKEDRNARQSQDAQTANTEPSTGETATETEDKEKEKDKDKVTEMKPPVVEHPDGVIHYLLSELLSYKDVDDKELPAVEPSETPAREQAEPQADVEMSMDEPTPSVTSSADAPTARPIKKGEKPSFDAEHHPIYIYRCFLLQCLTELLGSYTRAKVEFINFSRKADPLASTPSKPRSGILNYMLNALVPLGTMEHDESLAFKKRSITSTWTMQALVALCTKTYETPGSRRRNEPKPNEDDEPEVAFVRRFVLEHALRSFKEANASTEPLDSKYAKLMSLADLFDKMLSGYSFSQDAGFPNSARQIAKAMFEKHFIPALTASVAEIDLNFPSSKRVIKYILRPINKLTQTAVMLSDNGEITASTSGEEDDEISSATSVSDMEDEREETPDLFRHSTLGMLEPRHEEETSSEESEREDDEMYEDEYDEYDDEMDYDEEGPEDDGEVVSDEDDEVDGVGPIEGLPGDAVEVIIDDDDDEDDDEDDEDDEDLDDDSDMEEDDDDIYAGEITGDRDNESLHDGEENEWESEEITDDEEETEMMNQFEDELADMRQANRSGDAQSRIDEIFRALNQATGDDDLHDHGLGGDLHDEILDDMEEDGEEDEMDELEDEADDYDEYDIEGSEGDMEEEHHVMDPWGWDGDELMPARHHHHRMRGGPPSAWAPVTEIMPSRHGGLVPITPFHRVHRNQVGGRGNDDGTNPLLLRNDRGTDSSAHPRGPGADMFADWAQLESGSGSRFVHVDSPMSFMNAIMAAIGGGPQTPGLGVITRPDGIHVHVDRRSILPNRLNDLFANVQQQTSQSRRNDPHNAVKFNLSTTRHRWQEEARILFSGAFAEKSVRVVPSLLKVMVPPAMEEEKLRRKHLEEERKRIEQKRAEKERQEQAAREEEERERKRKEEEEKARLQAERDQQEAERDTTENAEPMEDIQQTTATEAATAQPEPVSTEPARRVHTTINGRQLDITGLEIDPEYLEALPEDLREEVIMQQLAEQRSQAAAAGEDTTEINQEFLEALPAEIRQELLQQEAADRRRRERDTARRQAAPSAAIPRAEDMDAASFLATLDPSLRQAVLADQPEDVLASLGPEYISEARALGGRRIAQFGDITGTGVDHRPRGEAAEDSEAKKNQRRPVVQMLEKAGVATLLRLMFMPLQGNARHLLNDILHNVCENRQNRSEVISLILTILQDGSVDSSAIERSFSHLSLRAKAPSAQKTPQSVKRNTAFQPTSTVSSEVTPIMVVQQCLSTLSFLSQFNPHIPWFFLTEHDSASSLKPKGLRKGKAKENRANKFALNALLSLLDRKLIMDSPNCMEQLSNLLGTITQPLTVLLRREKEKQEDQDKGKKPEGAPTAVETNDQPSAESGTDTTMTDAPLPTVENAEDQGTTTDMDAAKDESKTEGEQPGDEKRKRRSIEPPVVPDHNFRLVVHILAARECNGKTFRDTLSTINNLSVIPGARDVIGEELVAQAQTLSDTILADLGELLSHIHQAKTGTDMQGLALAKFSPASSDQAKLLRILTALDYLFDPSRADKTKVPEPESAPKEDVLKRLYESATFGPLWTKLSDCLTVIRQKENMLNVATILLPLIEALMVVCKNTTLKDQPLSRGSRELSVNSAAADAGLSMENLFFKFTEEHRKILNELVRQNPRLMSGTFSLLVKNPKVLEFDNKRNYFTRRVHARGAEPRHSHAPLQLSVRRDQVFLDSFKSLYFKSADELKYGKLNVRFHGEEGVDAGGVTREWFQVLARGMFNPNYALFIPVAADRTTFHPNRLSGVNSEHLMFFKFIGRIIGKALYEGRVLDCHFSRAVYKCILGRTVSIKDMETLDLDYYKSLLWMLENDITDIITENFAIETDAFGEKQVIDLIPNGRNIPVTQENKEEYIQRVVEYRLVESVREQLDNFLKGFHEIIPPDLISIFNEQELELLISGLPEIDVDEWKNNTEYHNYSASSPQIQWFWRAVRSFDKEERAKLLQFVTGTSKVPLNGFKELEGMNGVSKFNIHRDYGNKDRLPSAHTCFNQLDIPEYESYEDLRQRLYTAMTAGSEYFGFA
ncbi:hypothetical protein N7539_004595 [Penicillium diatomitis]|uniref:HECT-type E3 ubiquitin transferase n=1 Tax=Penicillium diatomitis TaxID=2819901 RepID=A0A9W9XE44_9EURO|nr:uncharacterized protein N7539_004595 [Penicillium diatomitis]KAJ5489705.1 hypothetical protein N7539_004595 [Penicillium diatomitis]